MLEPEDDVTKWRLRERAMFLGIAAWSLAVSVMMTYQRGELYELLEYPPGVLTAGILLTIGLLSAGMHLGLILIHEHVGESYDESLTEWER